MGIDRRHLSLLLGGLLVSELGSGATDVVVAWLVYVHTGSAGLTGLVWASSALAMLVGGPLSGYLADRLPRRRAMIAADAARAVLVAGLGLALLTGWFSLPVLLAAIFVEALLMLLFEGALQALVPTLSGGELERFNGRLQAARMIGGLAGPALGGLLLTTTSHPGSALLLDAATFVVSLCAVAAIAIDEPERAAGGGAGAVFAGLGSDPVGARAAPPDRLRRLAQRAGADPVRLAAPDRVRHRCGRAGLRPAQLGPGAGHGGGRPARGVAGRAPRRQPPGRRGARRQRGRDRAPGLVARLRRRAGRGAPDRLRHRPGRGRVHLLVPAGGAARAAGPRDDAADLAERRRARARLRRRRPAVRRRRPGAGAAGRRAASSSPVPRPTSRWRPVLAPTPSSSAARS